MVDADEANRVHLILANKRVRVNAILSYPSRMSISIKI